MRIILWVRNTYVHSYETRQERPLRVHLELGSKAMKTVELEKNGQHVQNKNEKNYFIKLNLIVGYDFIFVVIKEDKKIRFKKKNQNFSESASLKWVKVLNIQKHSYVMYFKYVSQIPSHSITYKSLENCSKIFQK